MKDKVFRGRAKTGIRYSEDTWSAKLNQTQAAQIKAKYFLFHVKQKDLALAYGVSISTISQIITGRTWQRIKNQ